MRKLYIIILLVVGSFTALAQQPNGPGWKPQNTKAYQTDSSFFEKDANFNSSVRIKEGNLQIESIPVLPNATELNILNGALVNTEEINRLVGVTSSIQTQINLKAALASPTFTGVPAAPTAAPGTNTTQIATTAYVIANGGAGSSFAYIDSANYYEQKINVIDYGADPTGTDYSDAAFSSAVALMTDRSYLYVPPGLYKLSEKITIEDLNYICIDVNGRLQFDANDSAFVFKNLRYAVININSMGGFGWMERPNYGDRTSVAVTIYDCANSEFNINQIYGYGKGIELYSDRSGGVGNQYVNINFNYIGMCNYGIYFDGIAPYGYNNEIKINGGQIRGNNGLFMDGSTAHAMQNELHNVGFERLDGDGLVLKSVRDLNVVNCRWESVGGDWINEDANCDYNRYYLGQTMYHSDLAYMHGRRSRIYGDILDDEGNDIYREMMKDSRDSAYYWTPRVTDVRMLNRTVKYADDFDSTPDYLFEAKINGEVKRYGRREDAPLASPTFTGIVTLPPTASPPVSPTEGTIYMDTDHHLYLYNGSAWVQLDN